MHSPQDHFIIPLPLDKIDKIFISRRKIQIFIVSSELTDVTHATLGPSGLWLGTWKGAGGTATQV